MLYKDEEASAAGGTLRRSVFCCLCERKKELCRTTERPRQEPRASRDPLSKRRTFCGAHFDDPSDENDMQIFLFVKRIQ